ncbi:MAG: energy transducer TonB [Bacteroidales bacterium]
MFEAMDEIVFEHRNKLYGAYFLRKLYNKHVTRALLISIAIMLVGLAYPLVSSYYALRRAKYIEKSVSAEMLKMDKPKEAAPPPPPPPPEAEEQKVKFVAPIVTTDSVVETPDIFNQDDLNKKPIEAVAVEEVSAAVVEEVIEVEEAKPIFTIVEEMPSFPGGEGELAKFLGANIVYPQIAKESGIQGTVYVSFVVDSKGKVTDVRVLRGIGGGCDEEALRVVRMMPSWRPGKQNGQSVRVQFNMPIRFTLN